MLKIMDKKVLTILRRVFVCLSKPVYYVHESLLTEQQIFFSKRGVNKLTVSAQ